MPQPIFLGLLTHGFKAEKMFANQVLPLDYLRSVREPMGLVNIKQEVEMRDSQSSNGAKAPVGSPHLEVGAA